MKNILKFLFIAFLAVSCSEDDIKNDLVDYEKGGFAKFENEIKTIDYQNGNGSLRFTALDANNNAASYSIYKISAIASGLDLGSVDVTDLNYTSFPAQVNISLNQLAGYFGLVGSDLTYGDSFRIFAKVTTKDGRVFKGEIPSTVPGVVPDGNVTTQDLLNSTYGYNQAMQFNVTVACPSFSAAAMLGTYAATVDPFVAVPTGHTFQCVQGANPNQLIFINWTDEGYDLIVDIDPASQSASVTRQAAWFHPTYGVASVAGSGLVFSCIGTLNLNLTHTVAAGSFGSHPITLVKQ